MQTRERSAGRKPVPVYDAVRRHAELAPVVVSEPRRGTSWPGIWGSLGVRRRTARARKQQVRPAGRADIWRTLRERADPAKFKPKLAADIEVKSFHARTGDYVMIANPRDLLHYSLTPSEAELLTLMDGTRTVEDIVVEHLEKAGDLDLSGVADLVLSLHQGNFLEQPYIDIATSVADTVKPISPAQKKLRAFAKTQMIEWTGAQRVARLFYDKGLRFFFTRWGKIFSIFVSLAGPIAFFDVVHRKTFRIGGSELALEGLILLGLNYFLTFSHETGHAAVVMRHGRRLKSAGFQLYFGSPAWFVDASDALMMDPKDRIALSFAGPYAELIVGGIVSLIIWLFPHIRVGHVLYKFVALNYLFVFFNLIPLLDLDGYHILSDAMQMPDLRPRSLSFIRHDLFRKIRARERFHFNEIGLGLYGLLGIVFTVLVSLVAALYWKSVFGGFIASLWRGGWGTRLILLLLALFIGGPLIRGAINFGRFVARKIRSAWRGLKFKFETSWRVEAAEMIDALPIFDGVPEDVLDDLAGRVAVRRVSQGATVVRQGERATAFYVVRDGRLEVFETDPRSGTENILRVLGRGESFGELAVTEASVRTASVRALEDSEVFEIDRSTFQRVLADMVHVPTFAPSFQQIAELRQLASFQHLEPDELAELLRYGGWVTYAPGEAIVKQGEKAEAFFAIGSGQVDVLQGRRLLRTLGPGSHFGELALLMRTTRTATVRARTAVRAYRLSRAGFDRLMRDAFKKGTLNPHAALDRTWQH